MDYNESDLFMGQISKATLERKVMLEIFKCWIVVDYSIYYANTLQN